MNQFPPTAMRTCRMQDVSPVLKNRKLICENVATMNDSRHVQTTTNP